MVSRRDSLRHVDEQEIHMKVLLASPAYEDSFADNVAMALREMGH
jgi:hypothetical protein